MLSASPLRRGDQHQDLCHPFILSRLSTQGELTRPARMRLVTRLLHLVASDQRRGAETFGVQLGEHLAADGHEVRVMAVTASQSGEVLPVELAGQGSAPRAVVDLVRAVRWAELVVAFGSITLDVASALGTLMGRPFIYRNIGDPSVRAQTPARSLRVRTSIRRAARVVALYPNAATELSERYGLLRANMRVIPRGVPDAAFGPTDAERRRAAREALGLGSDRRWLLYLGALSPEKDPLAAIELMGRLPDDVGLQVAGEGPLAEAVSEAARPFGDRIRLWGPVGDVRALFDATEVMVLPSLTEGIPGSGIEAGLSGVPVVASAVGGVPELIDDRVTGALVASSDPTALAAATLEALEHRDAWGTAARERCLQRFSMASVGARWAELVGEWA